MTEDELPPGTTAAFVSEQAEVAFPVLEDICCFLPEYAIALTQTARKPAARDSIKDSVQSWYEHRGWQRNAGGAYNDTADNAAGAGTAYRFYELEGHLSLLDRLGGGNFVLDAASGAVAMPEYLAYSWPFRHRVCVDFSITALQEAARKLGNRGFYCLSDICRLPFQDGVFDGVVSNYTVQHVPETDQARAVEQLYRCLAPGATCCIISSRKPGILRHIGGELFRPLQTRWPGEPSAAPPKLYHSPPRRGWWKNIGRVIGAEVEIKPIRWLSRQEFHMLFGRSLRMVRVLRGMENLFPGLISRWSSHIRIDLHKPAGAGRGSTV